MNNSELIASWVERNGNELQTDDRSILLIYHGNCPDGVTGVNLVIQSIVCFCKAKIDLLPLGYNLDKEKNSLLSDGKTLSSFLEESNYEFVIVVDYSIETQAVQVLINKYQDKFLVIDHHESVNYEQLTGEYKINCITKHTGSGADLALIFAKECRLNEVLSPEYMTRLEKIVKHVSDRDIFKYSEEAWKFYYGVTTSVWNKWSDTMGEVIPHVIVPTKKNGDKYHEKQAKVMDMLFELIKSDDVYNKQMEVGAKVYDEVFGTYREEILNNQQILMKDGFKILLFTFDTIDSTSDLCNLALYEYRENSSDYNETKPLIAINIYVTKDGQEGEVVYQFGVRSLDEEKGFARKFAELNGGGGHACASGFKVKKSEINERFPEIAEKLLSLSM